RPRVTPRVSLPVRLNVASQFSCSDFRPTVRLSSLVMSYCPKNRSSPSCRAVAENSALNVGVAANETLANANTSARASARDFLILQIPPSCWLWFSWTGNLQGEFGTKVSLFPFFPVPPSGFRDHARTSRGQLGVHLLSRLGLTES